MLNHPSLRALCHLNHIQFQDSMGICTYTHIYLSSVIKIQRPVRDLRSSTTITLSRFFSCSNFANKTFANAARKMWNSLSAETRNSSSFDIFQRRTKRRNISSLPTINCLTIHINFYNPEMTVVVSGVYSPIHSTFMYLYIFCV